MGRSHPLHERNRRDRQTNARNLPDSADNPAVRGIIDELKRDSSRFATLWDWQPVRERPLGTVHLAHLTVGALELHDTVMRLSDADEQLVLVFQAEQGSVSQQRLADLRRHIGDPA